MALSRVDFPVPALATQKKVVEVVMGNIYLTIHTKEQKILRKKAGSANWLVIFGFVLLLLLHLRIINLNENNLTN